MTCVRERELTQILSGGSINYNYVDILQLSQLFLRCDECLKCYHFGCLNPPVKKTPKVSGWAWSCSECAPSDEDKGWHL